jgi:predicted ATPase/DNA-binding SARP family transcriptional activator
VELFVRVLGPLEVWRDGAAVPFGGPKARLVLAALLAHRSSVVSVDRLVDAMWGDSPPRSAVATLQSNISRLRRALTADVEIVARAPGYVLEAAPDAVDASRFEDLATAAASAPPAAAVEYLGRALDLWRGPAFDEFADLEWARGEAARLEELRLVALESLLEARLALGEHGPVVGELERLVVDHPLRERFWRQLMIALYRSGRQAEAVRRADELRGFLNTELGLDLSPAARDLEGRIFADDPTLLLDHASPAGSTTAVGTPADASAGPAVDATRFVGRDGDLEAIGALLATDRLVTLVGPGGVGKTRLAVRIATSWPQRATSLPDSSTPCLVELAAIRDERAAMQAIAAALDVQQRHHLSLDATLIEFLRDRSMLIVLDNCEHLVDTLAPFVDHVRGACRQVTVLATSRAPLGLAGEQIWPVGPLALPGADARSVDAVGSSDAVQLFVDRASAAHPGFELTAENASSVAEICRRLDGLPLALELAAARLRSMGPYALEERLRERSNLLGASQRGADRRHRTLRDTLEWSYELLTPPEQQLFAWLATFVGGFDLRAAEAVCAVDSDPDAGAYGVADLLANLVDKSMVQVVDLDEPRYRLLETLREFGLERLEQRGERAKLRARHRAWYVRIASEGAAGLAGPDEAMWVARLDRDFENCREAHAGAVLAGDTETAVSLVASLREFAFRRMRYEVTAWAETTISMPGIELHPHVPIVIAVAAYGAFVRGDLDTAIELAEQAVTAADDLGTDSFGLAERTLGNAVFYRGRIDDGLKWMDRMLAVARAHDSPALLAHALYMQSVGSTSVGHAPGGAKLAAEAVAAAQRCGSPTALAQATYAMGVSLEATDPDEAAVHLRRAAQLGRAAGNRWIEAFAQTEVLWLEARKGDPAGALAGFASVIDTWYRGGDWANQWLSLRHVCGIFAQLGANRAAAVLYGSLVAAGAAAALPFEPTDAERIGELVEELRRRLGPAEFADAVHDGAATRDATIVAYVQDQIGRLIGP